jgi:hypothetical protein
LGNLGDAACFMRFCQRNEQRFNQKETITPPIL